MRPPRRRTFALLATGLACAAPLGTASGACSAGLAPVWSLELRADFPRALLPVGAQRAWGLANLSVTENDDGSVLSVRYPAGSINPENRGTPQGGAGFLYSGAHPTTLPYACLTYDVRFPEGFDFVRGGKLPGLYGGGAPSGGSVVTDESGFSVRLMWRQDGTGEAYAYTIDKRNPSYGDSVGRGSWRFTPGRWQHVELELAVNTPGQADGVLRVWIDGRLAIERRDTTYRAQSSAGIDGMMFSTFFGGHDASWATPREQHVEFRRIELLAPAR